MNNLQEYRCKRSFPDSSIQFVTVFENGNQLHISNSTFPSYNWKENILSTLKMCYQKLQQKIDEVLSNVSIFADTSLDRAPDTKIYAAIEYISSTMRFDKPLI